MLSDRSLRASKRGRGRPASVKEEEDVIEYASNSDEDAEEANDMSEFERQRLENIRRNNEILAKLGLDKMKEDIDSTVAQEKAKKIASKGVKSTRGIKKVERPPIRRSGRIAAISSPPGTFLDDSFETENPFYTSTGLFGNSLETAAKAKALEEYKQMQLPPDPVPMKSLIDPDDRWYVDTLTQLGRLVESEEARGKLKSAAELAHSMSQLKLAENDIAKVVDQRAYSLVFHPSPEKLFIVAGDKIGNIGFWDVDRTETDSNEEGIAMFRPHVKPVSRLQFFPGNPQKLYSTSYDMTVRCTDLSHHGSFNQVYANDKDLDNMFLTFSHILPDGSLMLLSNSDGSIMGLDLRTNRIAWNFEAHQKKINTVHACPSMPNIIATASLDCSVSIWDARKIGPKTKPAAVAKLLQERSINSAHFSPDGDYIVTTGQNNKLVLYNVSDVLNGKVSAVKSISHNNQTGRWLTKFQAVWDEKSRDLFLCGSMDKGPHCIDLYDAGAAVSSKSPLLTRLSGEEYMRSIQSLCVSHPALNVVAGINASGRCHVFRHP